MSVSPVEPNQTPPPTGEVVAPPVEKPWGKDEDFDAEKAWGLIQGLRSDKEKLSAREFLTAEQKADLAELDRLKAASKTELEKAQEAASQAAERINAMTSRAVAAEVKALAANSFADPMDAAAFLDLAKYSTADGEIDTAAISADLGDLLERKPHLGVPAGPADTRAPRPNPAQGASGSGPAGALPQLTEQDVDRLYADKKYAEIDAAKAQGRLNDLLGIT